MKRSAKKLIFSLSFVALLQANVAELKAGVGFDDPQPVKASDILPADLVKGKHFQVLDGVTWKEGLHEFTVKTEFGSFNVWGGPMLHVRLAEVDAWTELEKASGVGTGVKAVGGSLIDSVGALANAFAHPVKTIKGTPTGVSRMFKKTKHGVDRATIEPVWVYSNQSMGYPRFLSSDYATANSMCATSSSFTFCFACHKS